MRTGAGHRLAKLIRPFLPVAVVAALLAGCDTPEPPSAPVVSFAAPVSADGGEMTAASKITFFDSDAFDLDLAKKMAEHPDEIHVAFAGPVSVNQIPGRVNVWLSEVKRSDGQVTAVDPDAPAKGEAHRGLGLLMIVDVIDLVTTLYDRRQASARLGQAHAYDARVVYDSQTGTSHEIVFTKRQAPE